MKTAGVRLMNFQIFLIVEPQKNQKRSCARESHPDRRRVFILTVLRGFRWRGFALSGTVAVHIQLLASAAAVRVPGGWRFAARLMALKPSEQHHNFGLNP